MQPTMAMDPVNHGMGALKGRLASGSRSRDRNKQTETATKAARVPALANAAISAKGKNPAMTPTTKAVNKVVRVGVPREDSLASHLGNRPSRAIAKKIRLWP